MNGNSTQRRNESRQPDWQTARGRTSSEVLAILAPTAEEPEALGRAGIWKTGTLAVEESGSAA